MGELEYSVIIQSFKREDGGGFVAIAPNLPDCMSDDETPEGALHYLQDAIAAWIEISQDMGHKFPKLFLQLGLAN